MPNHRDSCVNILCFKMGLRAKNDTEFQSFLQQRFFFCHGQFQIAEIVWWGFNIYILYVPKKKKMDLHVGQFNVACKTWFGSITFFSFILDSSLPLELLAVGSGQPDQGITFVTITFVFPKLILAEPFTVFSMIGWVAFETPLLWLYGFFFLPE